MIALALVMASLCGAEPTLDEGRALFRALKYEEALGKLEQAVEVPGLSTLERREAFELLARTWAALGNLPRAQAVYGQLLAHDAGAPAPDDAAPKIREAFRAAKLALFPLGTVKLTRLKAGDGLLRFTLFDPWSEVVKLELLDASGVAQSLAPQVTSEVRAGNGVWLEATNAKGEKVATLGSRAKPLRLSRPAVHAHSAPAAAPEEAVEDEEPVVAATPALGPAAPAAGVASEPAPHSASWRLPVTFAVGGLAAAAAIASIVLGVRAQSDAALVADPSMLSQRAAFEVAAEQRTFATVTNVLITVALAALVAAVAVFIAGPP